MRLTASSFAATTGMAMAALLCPLHAAVTLGPLFSDHMVLQREKPIVIYGKADPGETVTVEFLQAKASTRASAKGVWELKLPPQAANSTPSPLVVTDSNTSRSTMSWSARYGSVRVSPTWPCW